MLAWVLTHIQSIGVGLTGVFCFLTLRSNRNLKNLKKELESRLEENGKIIDIQQKVIDVTENTKPSDFDGNIKRMQDGKL